MGGFRARRNAGPDGPGVAGAGPSPGDVVLVDYDPARAGEDGSDDGLGRIGPVEEVGEGRALPGDLQKPRPRQRLREGKGCQQVAKGREAHRLGPRRVVADGPQSVAERAKIML